MDKEVVWTPQAINKFETVLNYLTANWGEKVTREFILKTFTTIDRIKSHPEIYVALQKSKYRKALITRHNLMIYKDLPNKLVIRAFWDTRENRTK